MSFLQKQDYKMSLVEPTQFIDSFQGRLYTPSKKVFARKPVSPHCSSEKRKKSANFQTPRSAHLDIVLTAKQNEATPKQKLTLRKQKQSMSLVIQKEADVHINNIRLIHHTSIPLKLNQISKTDTVIGNLASFRSSQLDEKIEKKGTALTSKTDRDSIRKQKQQILNTTDDSIRVRAQTNVSLLHTQTEQNDNYSQTKSCFIQCQYCRNNKKMVVYLKDKYEKINEILQQKDYILQKFKYQSQVLHKQLATIKKTFEKEKIDYQSSYKNLSKIKEDLQCQLQNMKRDNSRMGQKIKYLQIQNNILLRFKDQYQLITGQNDKLSIQNKQIKNQLTMLQKNIVQRNKRLKNSQVQNRRLSSDYAREYNILQKEEDILSLTFSEKSLQPL